MSNLEILMLIGMIGVVIILICVLKKHMETVRLLKELDCDLSRLYTRFYPVERTTCENARDIISIRRSLFDHIVKESEVG